MTTESTVFTIGHSNHPFDKFVGLLKRHHIEKVVDVRSIPASRHFPQFNKKRLDAALQDHGIAYVPLGHCLGGRPKNRQYYDEEGTIQYDLIAAGQAFRDCIELLLTMIPAARIALLCGEEDPVRCHRRLLVTPVLLEGGVQVLHIRGDGRLQTEESFQKASSVKDA